MSLSTPVRPVLPEGLMYSAKIVVYNGYGQPVGTFPTRKPETLVEDCNGTVYKVMPQGNLVRITSKGGGHRYA